MKKIDLFVKVSGETTEQPGHSSSTEALQHSTIMKDPIFNKVKEHLNYMAAIIKKTAVGESMSKFVETGLLQSKMSDSFYKLEKGVNFFKGVFDHMNKKKPDLGTDDFSYYENIRVSLKNVNSLMLELAKKYKY